MARSIHDQVMSRRAFAIVDEVDSILIDEARTPLIISAPDDEPTSKYLKFAQISAKLSHPEDYTIDEKTKTINYRTGDSIKHKSMFAGGGMSGSAVFEGSEKPSMDCEKCGKAITEREFDANFGKCKSCKSK